MKIDCLHIGYYNETEDIKFLGGATPNEIVQYHLDGQGAFYSTDDDKVDLDDTTGQYTTDKKYLVTKDLDYGGEDGFIDIYKVYNS